MVEISANGKNIVSALMICHKNISTSLFNIFASCNRYLYKCHNAEKSCPDVLWPVACPCSGTHRNANYGY